MTCCSNRREAASGNWLRAATVATGAPPAKPSNLRYLGPTAIALRGPSGRIYTVQPGLRPIAIDVADRTVLLKTGFFAEE
jgi:hypothetical protein